MQNSFRKIFRYTVPILLGIGVIVLVFECELDPWIRGEKTDAIDPMTGKKIVIQTDIITITKTTKQFAVTQTNARTPLYKNYSKPVVLSHRIHAKHGVTCARCHHKEHNPERNKICAACHFGFEGLNTMHRFCLSCHSFAKKGDTNCNRCHK